MPVEFFIFAPVGFFAQIIPAQQLMLLVGTLVIALGGYPSWDLLT